MLHHLSFAVADLPRSAAFYDAALAPLGYVRVWADDTAVGYGSPGGDDEFAIRLRPREVVVPGGERAGASGEFLEVEQTSLVGVE